VNNDSLAATASYGVDSGQLHRFEFGAFASVSYAALLGKTGAFKTRLDLFSNYLLHPQNINLYWTNTLSMSVSRLISINFSLELVYDNATKSVKPDGTPGGPALQVMEVMGLGLSYKFSKRKRR